MPRDPRNPHYLQEQELEKLAKPKTARGFRDIISRAAHDIFGRQLGTVEPTPKLKQTPRGRGKESSRRYRPTRRDKRSK